MKFTLRNLTVSLSAFISLTEVTKVYRVFHSIVSQAFWKHTKVWHNTVCSFYLGVSGRVYMLVTLVTKTVRMPGIFVFYALDDGGRRTFL